MAPSSKLLRLPARGRLLVVADLHGNLRDFLAVAAIFEQLRSTSQPRDDVKDDAADGFGEGCGDDEVFLLFLGDLLHGPYLPLEQWAKGEKDLPLLRGRPYRDQSPAVLLGVSELMARHPRRVFTLLGNHEHAHIGGPRTSLFARDEAVALEQRLGVEASLWLHGFLKGLPLWALAPCGVLLSHAAPAAELTRLEEIEAIDYRRYTPPNQSPRSTKGGAAPEAAARLLGQLLWGSSLAPHKAQDLLSRIGAKLAIYGHSVVPAGYQAIGGEQLILSTSFGMEDAHKRLLLIDLSARYQSVFELRPGIEILPLYPKLAASLSARLSGETLARWQPSR